ncbi:hypothetical protein FWF74_02025 [Candidatus Saccharibacteria bacterium]|nr:hypothetical protein [Candidatus Saccharibacteria bacterium]MCL1963261.1 hypothetical protein [Candidatus Saccharibacteria bacterium]
MDAENTAAQSAKSEKKGACECAQQAQYVVTTKSLKGIGGWLTFALISLASNAASGFVMFFYAMAELTQGVEGIDAALSAETMIFSLLLAAAALITTILVATRKKLGVLMALVTMGITALYSTVQSITRMFQMTERCDYDGYSFWQRTCETVSKSPDEIIKLVAVIFVVWLGAFLIGLYFKTSKRVKLTLTK